MSTIESCGNVLEFDTHLVAPFNGYPVSFSRGERCPPAFPFVLVLSRTGTRTGQYLGGRRKLLSIS